MKHKKTIAYRITKAMLLMCAVTLFASAVFSGIARIRLQNLLRDSGTDIGVSASEMSADTLLENSVSATRDFIAARAEFLDAYLKNIKDNLTLIQVFAANIYNQPERYSDGSVPYFTEVPHGVFSAHYLIDHRFTLTPELEREINMLANITAPIEAMMRLHGEIFSMYIITESGAWIFFDDEAHTKNVIVENEINFFERPWYINATEKGGVSITDTYEDASGRGLCITFSIPVYASNGDLMGVIGADIGMRELSNKISSMTASGVEFVILAGQNGVIASSILGEVEGAEQLPLGMEEIWNHHSGVMTLAVPAITHDEQAYIESYIIWDSLALTDWKLIGFNTINVVIAPTEGIRASISELTDDLVAKAESEGMRTGILTMFALVGVLIFAMLYARKTSKNISAPIVSLTDGAIKIGHGEIDCVLEIKTGDEIQTLADTINKMVADIKHITGEKERIGAELDVATKIQASMLPCIFPAFPDRDEFDIYGYMLPAKEVGGDFYDFFLVDERKLAMVIADVSGKGIPAALFMVIAKTLIKNNAQAGKTPKEVFETVNDMLCENNEAQMFVTAFMGIWDMKTGVFTYANAGHNPPLIKRVNGEYEWLNTLKPGFVLAGMEGMKYRQGETTLNDGDMVFMYTDGVTEAVNLQNELFTDPRLIETVNKHKTVDLNDFIAHIKAEIDFFANGAEQADDITMLIMKVTGSGGQNV
jgi:sigma-B regulation protein RsbU (phosphoserine phosphatase)